MTLSAPTRLFLLILLTCTASRIGAQSADQPDLASIGRDVRWKVVNRAATIAEVNGKRAVKLDEHAGMGVVWLDGYDLENGVIDIDILGRSQPVQGSFVGVAFHAIDAKTYESVYFRPFNFQAPDPERHGHAVQYVSHPRWPWQVLRSEHPGKYEQAVVQRLDGDQWFHARIVIERPKVSVFVNAATTPCLVVNELGDLSHGSVGLWVGEGSGGYFANLHVLQSR